MFGSPYSDESSFYEDISVKLSDIGAARISSRSNANNSLGLTDNGATRSSIRENEGEIKIVNDDFTQSLHNIEKSQNGVKYLIQSEQRKRTALSGGGSKVLVILVHSRSLITFLFSSRLIHLYFYLT